MAMTHIEGLRESINCRRRSGYRETNLVGEKNEPRVLLVGRESCGT
jgi:hypothetical protein